MEDTLNIDINMFTKYLSYYLKIGIYINKGCENYNLLEYCINLYNKYKSIENSKNINSDEEILLRRTLKRFNLILKIDENGKHINLKNKEIQKKIIYLTEHPTIKNDDLENMLEFAKINNINILSNIPLLFILKENKYQNLLWQYTRLLYYITQIIIVNNINTEDHIKNKIYNDSLNKLETILTTISEIEQKNKLKNILETDFFLNEKLIKNITKSDISEASNEVKEIFNKKGINNNPMINKMIDLISDKMTNINLSDTNIFNEIFNISKNVACELNNEGLTNNKEDFMSAMLNIRETFKEDIIQDNNNQVPNELKGIFNNLFNMPLNNNNNPEEIINLLDNIIQTNNLDRDQFYNEIRDKNGNIDINMLQQKLLNIDINLNK